MESNVLASSLTTRRGCEMPEPRTIRKHSNRRLWDPLRRGYLVLADIQDLVVARTEFNVIDNDRADVTRSELLQVITAQERKADTSMTTEFLLQAIRSHAESPSGMTATFLEQTLRMFNDLPDKRKVLQGDAAADSSRTIKSLATANFKRWRSAEKIINRTLANATSKDGSPPRRLGKFSILLTARRPERQSRRSPRPSRVMTRRP